MMIDDYDDSNNNSDYDNSADCNDDGSGYVNDSSDC